MARIAKSNAEQVLDRIAQNLKAAAGEDGITSRADVKKALENVESSVEKALTHRFFNFIDHRDFRPGARVTARDIDRAIEYAKEHLFAKYDVNHNGYSKSEIAKMSRIGQLTIELVCELKGIAKPSLPTPTSELGKAIAKAAKDTYYVSESDSQPVFVSADFDANRAITGEAVSEVLREHLEKSFDIRNPADFAEITFEAFSAQESRDFLPGLAERMPDPEDEYYRKNAEGFARIKAVFDEHITDVHVFKFGPKDEETGELATDRGAYQYLVVGRTQDNKLAGISFESVET
jgi:hypothetical protein